MTVSVLATVLLRLYFVHNFWVMSGFEPRELEAVASRRVSVSSFRCPPPYLATHLLINPTISLLIQPSPYLAIHLHAKPPHLPTCYLATPLPSVVDRMPIRIRISILMPIRIRIRIGIKTKPIIMWILPQVLKLLENLIFFTFSQKIAGQYSMFYFYHQ